MDDGWRFCPKCGKPNTVNDTIAGTVQRWRRRVGKRKNDVTIAELVAELQTEVSAGIQQLRDELKTYKEKAAKTKEETP